MVGMPQLRTSVWNSVTRLKMSRIFVDLFIMQRLIIITLFVASANSFAGERYEFYTGVRQMGMGGAAVAVANDETAMLSNPAGLGKLRDYFITLFDPDAEVGVETNAMSGFEGYRAGNPQWALDTANLNPDKHLHVKGQVFPSVVVPNFGIGVFWRNSIDAELNTTSNKFEYNYMNDYALVMGVNFRLWDGIIKVGANGRVVNRTEVHDDQIDPTSTTLELKNLAKSGVGVGSDAGLIITAPVAWLPSIAGVYRDLGGTSYAMRDGLFMTTTNKPDRTSGTVDGALAIQPILGKRFRSTWTVELRDCMNVAEEDDFMRRVHGGVEFNYADALFLRGGMNQRYWTAGLELSMMNYQFQAASYGEDIGPVGTPREDRRYEVKFAFRF